MEEGVVTVNTGGFLTPMDLEDAAVPRVMLFVAVATARCDPAVVQVWVTELPESVVPSSNFHEIVWSDGWNPGVEAIAVYVTVRLVR
jgi:hypothetical protein